MRGGVLLGLGLRLGDIFLLLLLSLLRLRLLLFRSLDLLLRFLCPFSCTSHSGQYEGRSRTSSLSSPLFFNPAASRLPSPSPCSSLFSPALVCTPRERRALTSIGAFKSIGLSKAPSKASAALQGTLSGKARPRLFQTHRGAHLQETHLAQGSAGLYTVCTVPFNLFFTRVPGMRTNPILTPAGGVTVTCRNKVLTNQSTS